MITLPSGYYFEISTTSGTFKLNDVKTKNGVYPIVSDSVVSFYNDSDEFIIRKIKQARLLTNFETELSKHYVGKWVKFYEYCDDDDGIYFYSIQEENHYRLIQTGYRQIHSIKLDGYVLEIVCQNDIEISATKFNTFELFDTNPNIREIN